MHPAMSHKLTDSEVSSIQVIRLKGTDNSRIVRMTDGYDDRIIRRLINWINTSSSSEQVTELEADVGGQELVPLKVANLAAFLIYRYKFLSRVVDNQQPQPDVEEVTECNFFNLEDLPRPISDFTISRIKDAFNTSSFGSWLFDSGYQIHDL